MGADKQVWPDHLMIRDTGLHDDAGGLGQRIFTTAGAGYTKVKYVRADLAANPSACELVVDDAMVERVCRNHFPDWDMYGPAGKMVRFADIRRLLTAALQHRGDSQEVGRG